MKYLILASLLLFSCEKSKPYRDDASGKVLCMTNAGGGVPVPFKGQARTDGAWLSFTTDEGVEIKTNWPCIVIWD